MENFTKGQRTAGNTLRVMCFTEVVVEGELVIVPDLDGQARSHFSLGFIQTPEMFLQTQRVCQVLSFCDLYSVKNVFLKPSCLSANTFKATLHHHFHHLSTTP